MLVTAQTPPGTPERSLLSLKLIAHVSVKAFSVCLPLSSDVVFTLVNISSLR